METTLLSSSDAKWKLLLCKCAHDFYHLPGYVELEAKRLGGAPCAILIEEGECVFFMPFVLRQLTIAGKTVPGYEQTKDAISPYGYPCPLIHAPSENNNANEFLQSALEVLKNEMATRKVCSAFVRLHPLLDAYIETLSLHGTVVEHGETVWIDLTLPESELWRQTRASHRHKINKLKKLNNNSIIARMDESWECFPQFIDIYHKTMNHVKAESWYHFGEKYFKLLKEILGPQISLCVIEDSGIVASAGLFTECCGFVQFHLSGTNPETPHKDSSKLMLNFVRSWAKERGNKQFHLGGGMGAQADNLFSFKAGFSKLRSPFYSWRIIFDSEIYGAAIDFWEELAQEPADDIQGFFPPYRKPMPGTSVNVHE